MTANTKSNHVSLKKRFSLVEDITLKCKFYKIKKKSNPKTPTMQNDYY